MVSYSRYYSNWWERNDDLQDDLIGDFLYFAKLEPLNELKEKIERWVIPVELRFIAASREILFYKNEMMKKFELLNEKNQLILMRKYTKAQECYNSIIICLNNNKLESFDMLIHMCEVFYKKINIHIY